MINSISEYFFRNYKGIFLVLTTCGLSVSAGLIVSGKVNIGSGAILMSFLGGGLLFLGGAPIGVALLYLTAFIQTWKSIPTPGLAFIYNISPWTGLGIFLIGVIILSANSLPNVFTNIKKCWGIIYLVIYVVSGLIIAPLFYPDPVGSISTTFVTTLTVMCIIPFLAYPKVKIFTYTKWMLTMAFGVMFFLYFYFIITNQSSSVGSIIRAGEEFSKVNRVFGGGNDSAGLFITLIPFGIYFIYEKKLGNVFLAGFLLLSVYIIYRSFTRMAWVGLPVVLIVYFWGINKKAYVYLTLILITMAALFFSPVNVLFGEISRTGGIAEDAANNLSGRIYSIWLPMINYTLRNTSSILFGTGDNINPSLMLPGGLIQVAHNIWVEKFTARGITGVILWLLYTLNIFWFSIKAALKLPPMKRHWLVAGIAALIGYNIYGLSANSYADHAFITSILIGTSMWAYQAVINKETFKSV